MGIVGVPGIDRKSGLHDRQVVLVLGVEALHRHQAVAESRAQAWFDRKDIEEVVSHAGCRASI